MGRVACGIEAVRVGRLWAVRGVAAHGVRGTREWGVSLSFGRFEWAGMP